MRQITTASGFTAEVEESRLDDMELFDALEDLSRGNKLALRTVLDKILGEDKKRLYEHLRAEDGHVPASAVMAEATEIFNLLSAKNS